MWARNSCTLNFEVSMTRSAMARMRARCLRSAVSEALTGVLVPSGCGRRVSLKRRSRTASCASRKMTFVGRIMLCTDLKMAGSSSSCAPSRTSTTSAVRRFPPTASQFGETRNQVDGQDCRRSSSQDLQRPFSTEALPDPLMPVMMTSSPGPRVAEAAFSAGVCALPAFLVDFRRAILI